LKQQVGGIVSVVGSLIFPEDFDFVSTRALKTYDGSKLDQEAKTPELPDEKTDAKDDTTPPSLDMVKEAKDEPELDPELDPVKLEKAFKLAMWSSVTLVLILLILVSFSFSFTKPALSNTFPLTLRLARRSPFP
jgi:hypothetical protein